MIKISHEFEIKDLSILNYSDFRHWKLVCYNILYLGWALFLISGRNLESVSSLNRGREMLFSAAFNSLA